MSAWEYKVVPAPTKGVKARGLKGPEDRFANALEILMNNMGADGWEFQRAETLPSIERSGLTGTTTEWRNMMVFRRATEDAGDAFKHEMLPPPDATFQTDPQLVPPPLTSVGKTEKRVHQFKQEPPVATKMTVLSDDQTDSNETGADTSDSTDSITQHSDAISDSESPHMSPVTEKKQTEEDLETPEPEKSTFEKINEKISKD